MKNFFLSTLALLIIFSQWITFRLQGTLDAAKSKIPVLYWVTQR